MNKTAKKVLWIASIVILPYLLHLAIYKGLDLGCRYLEKDKPCTRVDGNP